MSYTRRQFVEAAFEEMGMAAYTFDITPQMMESAARRLDAMMATWNARGIRIGFPLPLSPQDTDLDTETGVPDAANEAIIANLAINP
ncbi:MAG: packaged DNA stabilization gp4 family protein, partial [Bacteroidota bacterium]